MGRPPTDCYLLVRIQWPEAMLLNVLLVIFYYHNLLIWIIFFLFLRIVLSNISYTFSQIIILLCLAQTTFPIGEL